MRPDRTALRRLRRQETGSFRLRNGFATVATACAAVGLAAGCSPSLAPPAPAPVLEIGDPDPARVEALVLLVGDAGTAFPGRSPLLDRVAADVEAWAPRLPMGGTVVAYLGDLVYPWGVRPPKDPAHHADTLHLRAQLEPLLGPEARASGARGWFIDGNHDWGHLPGDAGLARLRTAAGVVERWAAAGHPVRFAPNPGDLGPEAVDIGASHRLLFMGTQAWLRGSDDERRAAAEALADALNETERTVTVLAHHPLQSAGEHGPEPPVETGFGFQHLASRAGVIRQDMSSRPYRDLIAGVTDAMALRPPLVWAGGHDHTLQLLRGAIPGMPHWTVVSGSASKVGLLGRTPELVAGGGWPGYVRLFLLDDGSGHLQMVAAPADAQHCAQVVAAELAACMDAGRASYRTVISRLLQPR